MHKKISAELTSLAHSILQMKNKDDVFTLKQKAYKVYEKLTVLAYVEEYIKTTPQATETKEELIAKIEAVSLNQKNETILAKKIINKESFNTTTKPFLTPPIQNEPINTVNSNITSDIEENTHSIKDNTTTQVENKTIPENKNNLNTTETEKTNNNTTPTTQVENKTITENKNNLNTTETEKTNNNTIPTTQVENKTITENRDTINDLEKNNDIQKEISNLLGSDIASIENAKINTENYFSETYKKATEKPKENTSNKTEEQTVLFDNTNTQKEPKENNNERKTITLEEELQGTLGVDVMANLFEKAEPPKTLNDLLQKTIHIGLNDRIAFVKHLFNGNQTDYNRVISQLNTIESEKEAKSFIKKIVKPEYNWSEKEEYETRLIEIIERKFS